MKPLIVAIAGTKPRALGPDAEKGAPRVVMKRLLLIISSIFALAACSNGGVSSSADDKAISFSDVSTRATLSDLEANGFGVWAGMENADGYIPILENEKVYQDNGAWTYDNKRYWFDNCTFHFFAVYPYFNSGEVQFADLLQSGNTYSGYQINFETPSTADQDLLVDMATVCILGSDKAENEDGDQFEDVYPTVNFDFAHILSKINLKVAKNSGNADEKIKVTRVVLEGVKKSGSFCCSRWSEYTDNWVVSDSPTMEVSRDMDVEITTAGTEVLGDGLLLIPQVIASSDKNESLRVKLTIRYDYYPQGSNIATTYEASTFLEEGSWEANTIYGYSVVLNPIENYILFTTPTIKPWGDPQSVGGTIIIH